MKNISKILVAVMLSVGVFSSCDDLLSVDSDRFISADDHNMKAANDTLYGMYGVFSQLQKLADSYVLLGELRADLMDVTDTADVYLKEIYNHNVSPNNPYVNVKAYYAVINNCNYILNKIDTTQVIKGEKAMLRTYAAAKAIRAWTYMQVALNFGKATYFDKPILSVDDAFATYPEYTMEELAPRLIAELEPYRNVPFPSFVEGVIPVRFIIGDLYLWSGSSSTSAGEPDSSNQRLTRERSPMPAACGRSSGSGQMRVSTGIRPVCAYVNANSMACDWGRGWRRSIPGSRSRRAVTNSPRPFSVALPMSPF